MRRSVLAFLRLVKRTKKTKRKGLLLFLAFTFFFSFFPNPVLVQQQNDGYGHTDSDWADVTAVDLNPPIEYKCYYELFSYTVSGVGDIVYEHEVDSGYIWTGKKYSSEISGSVWVDWTESISKQGARLKLTYAGETHTTDAEPKLYYCDLYADHCDWLFCEIVYNKVGSNSIYLSGRYTGSFEVSGIWYGGLFGIDKFGAKCVFDTVPPNSPPTARISVSDTVNEGGSVVVDAFGSSDPDGDDLSYEWSTTPSDRGRIEDHGKWIRYYAPDDVSSDTPVYIALTVDDGHGHTDSDGAYVTVIDLGSIVSIGIDPTSRTIYRVTHPVSYFTVTVELTGGEKTVTIYPREWGDTSSDMTKGGIFVRRINGQWIECGEDKSFELSPGESAELRYAVKDTTPKGDYPLIFSATGATSARFNLEWCDSPAEFLWPAVVAIIIIVIVIVAICYWKSEQISRKLRRV